MTEYPPPPPGDYPPPPGGNYPPPPPPGGPGYGGYPAPAAKTNSLAIASLVSSGIGIICGIGGIVGIVLGIIARSQIKNTGESGDGLALAGIIVGAVVVLLGIIGGVYYFNAASSLY